MLSNTVLQAISHIRYHIQKYIYRPTDWTIWHAILVIIMYNNS